MDAYLVSNAFALNWFRSFFAFMAGAHAFGPALSALVLTEPPETS